MNRKYYLNPRKRAVRAAYKRVGDAANLLI